MKPVFGAPDGTVVELLVEFIVEFVVAFDVEFAVVFELLFVVFDVVFVVCACAVADISVTATVAKNVTAIAAKIPKIVLTNILTSFQY